MIAIIPARGDSKGLPGKNIKRLLGKPMIAYTIEAATESKYIHDVYVSTDSKEIAEVAIKHGAKCPFLRPMELATDDSLAIDTYKYVVDRLNTEKHVEKKIEDFVVLQPTSPLREVIDINNSIELFYKYNADSVISFAPDRHPVFWHKYLDKNNKIIDMFPDSTDNRQSYRQSYFPNGAIYVFKYNIIRDNLYYTDKSYAYIMDHNKSVDIDSIDDFNFAEFLLRKRASHL